MYDGGEDVARWLVRELRDVFAEIGLEDPNTGAGQGSVQPDLFGHHRLRFHHVADAVSLGDLEDGMTRLGRVARPMDVASVGDEVALQRLEEIG